MLAILTFNIIVCVLVCVYISTNFTKKKWIVVEGNIGSGKTSLLEYIKIKHNNKVEIIKEPIDIWQSIHDENGNNLFELYCNNPQEYAFIFQYFVFKSRIKSCDHPQKCKLRISERSIFTDKHVFMNAMINCKYIKYLESKCYMEIFDWLSSKFKKPDAIIYLRTDPLVSLQRKYNRSRKGEESIDINYIKLIHDNHEKWLHDNNDIPIIIVNGNNSLDEIYNELFEKYIRYII